MKKILVYCFCLLLLASSISGCGTDKERPRIGVAFGVGAAVRWQQEKVYMEEYAQDLGADIEVRLNQDENAKPFQEDCMELIDSGIDVLIVRPRDINDMHEVVKYANENKVKIISYAGLITGEKIDLFVGYDCERIGQKMGQYLAETVFRGDYILLSGDPKDANVSDLLYEGAMRYLEPIEDDINIILDTSVPNWSPDEAKKLVTGAVLENNKQIDAILAPNDKVAGACAEALKELGFTKKVAIAGMDAELDAVRRIAAGTQSSTVYMDVKELSHIAVDQAVRMARNGAVETNTELDNQSGAPIPSNLMTGQLVVKENLDRILIESGYYTKEEIYGAE